MSIRGIERLVAVLMLSLFGSCQVIAQCEPLGPINITDLSIQQIPIEIMGADSNDLSSPNQGICGIEIEFAHEFVGDLIIQLTSPAGQTITLTGPSGPFGLTEFTNWDIVFLPCAEPVNPDAGFSATWSNNQTWGLFGNYNGSYYPFQGCLEDFDIGPVNGEWTLFIQDSDVGDDGVIESFRIIFCNEDGLDCFACNPIGGVMGISAIRGCQGSDSLNRDLEILFDPEPAPEDDFLYQYVISQAGQVVDIVDTNDFRTFPAGAYTLCGISIARIDSARLDTFIGGTFNDLFVATLFDETFCAELSENCVPLNVFLTPEPTADTARYCRGDTIIYADTIFAHPGDYTVILATMQGCDSVINVHVIEIAPQSVALVSDTITCDQDTALLDGSSSIFGQDATLTWISSNGNISGPINQSVAIADQPGTYQLIIEEYGCMDTSDFVTVEIDTVSPDFEVILDTLTCDVNEVTLFAQGGQDGDTYMWQFEDQTVIVGDSVSVTEPGMISITALSVNGCESDQQIEVVADTNVPVVMWTLDTLDCFGDTVQFVANPLSDYEYHWVGPAGFEAFISEPDLFTPGAYTIEVSNDQGCLTIYNFDLINRNDTPFVSVMTLPISCISDSGYIELSELPDVIYNWSGPEILPDEAVVYPTISGEYIATLTNSITGCTAQFEAIVGDERRTPTATVTAEMITCTQVAAEISVETPEDDVLWQGPSLFESTMKTDEVMVPGLYSVIVSDENGCDTMLSVIVDIDTISPNAIVSDPDSLGCDENPVLLDGSASGAGADIVYDWTTIGGDFVGNTNGISASASDAGIYILTVVNQANGCTSSDTVEVFNAVSRPTSVMFDIIQPVCFPASIGTFQITSVEGGTEPYFVQIDGSPPEGINQIFSIPSGMHDLTILDANGCRLDTFFSINTPTGYNVSLPNDTTILLGSSLLIDFQTSLPQNEINSILWVVNGETTCPGCDALLFDEEVTSFVEIIITDVMGCRYGDQMTVTTFSYPRVYIPNAFSPNDDGVNDVFVVHAGGSVSHIELLQIFDRWGTKVFERVDIPYSDERHGWRGDFNGEPLNPAVFTCLVRVVLSDGNTLLRKGQINLIR